MGEKEQGIAQRVTAPRDVMTGQSSGRSIPENSIEAGDVDGDGMPDAAQKVVTKTSSNIQNNREAGSGGPGGAQAVQYNESELEFRKAGDAGGSGAAEAGPIRLDPTPARVSQGGGDDIAIGDPGVNGN